MSSTSILMQRYQRTWLTLDHYFHFYLSFGYFAVQCVRLYVSCHIHSPTHRRFFSLSHRTPFHHIIIIWARSITETLPQHTSKGKHLFHFGISHVLSLLHCEKEYSSCVIFLTACSFFLTFSSWMGQLLAFLILSFWNAVENEWGKKKKEWKREICWCWCWLKVGWMHWLLRYADEYISDLMVVSI